MEANGLTVDVVARFVDTGVVASGTVDLALNSVVSVAEGKLVEAPLV